MAMAIKGAIAGAVARVIARIRFRSRALGWDTSSDDLEGHSWLRWLGS